jgi:hypothetical protein
MGNTVEPMTLPAALPLEGASSTSPDHELCAVLRARGCALNAVLVEMLNEHFSHCTERRGCGFTQATRHLAVLVNRPRRERFEATAKLFPDWARAAMYEAPAATRDGAWAGDGGGLRELLQVLRTLPERLEREESRLLASIIRDIVMPSPEGVAEDALPACFDELKVGTCPLAEKYFLEIGHGHVRRKGRVNVLVSDRGEPLLLEKLNLGDNHSCISLVELSLNGVRLPAGCLFGVQREESIQGRPAAKLPGDVIPIAACQGFRFLRLTTLAVSTAHRQRAFSAHFRAQVDAGLFAPGETTIQQLRGVAEEQL